MTGLIAPTPIAVLPRIFVRASLPVQTHYMSARHHRTSATRDTAPNDGATGMGKSTCVERYFPGLPLLHESTNMKPPEKRAEKTLQ
jgi:hypothetical protein